MTQLPRTPSFRLDGKSALVTGASSGIGLGCAVALAQAGATVTLAARRNEALETLAEAIRAEGGSAETLQLDITDTDAMQNAIAARPAFDIVINSAGLAVHGPSFETEPQDFDRVSAVNLKAAYFLAQASANRLVAEGKSGSIVTISSQMAHVGGMERAVYCATKHGVEGFTKAMAIEFGPHNIRINTICPTFIRTALTEPTLRDPEKRAWVEGMIKLDRMGEVEDIMGATVFLASDASALITGTSLLVDGGWTAH